MSRASEVRRRRNFPGVPSWRTALVKGCGHAPTGSGSRGKLFFLREVRASMKQVQAAVAFADSGLVETAAANTGLAGRFSAVRRRTVEICAPLTPEDMMVQSCPEASPAKWHLAHTAWFFESFVLREFLPGYRPLNPDFQWLFNSYYEGYSAFPEKKLRASFSRPAL